MAPIRLLTFTTLFPNGEQPNHGHLRREPIAASRGERRGERDGSRSGSVLPERRGTVRPLGAVCAGGGCRAAPRTDDPPSAIPGHPADRYVARTGPARASKRLAASAVDGPRSRIRCDRRTLSVPRRGRGDPSWPATRQAGGHHGPWFGCHATRAVPWPAPRHHRRNRASRWPDHRQCRPERGAGCAWGYAGAGGCSSQRGRHRPVSSDRSRRSSLGARNNRADGDLGRPIDRTKAARSCHRGDAAVAGMPAADRRRGP